LSVGILEPSKVVNDEQTCLFVKEAVNISEQPVAVTSSEIDASIFLSYAAETMLRELEKLPDESNSLADLFLKLNHVSAVRSHCSFSASCNTVAEIIDSCVSESGLCSAHKQKPRLGRLHETRARIAELEENSRDIVSLFIPPDAPKLSFLNDSFGMSV